MITSSSRLGGLIFSLTVSAIFCVAILPSDFVTGQSSFWAAQNEDVTQYVSGLRAYLASGWNFPLLAVPSLDWPRGTIVTFVDGIPLLALATKVAYSFLGVEGNPYGLWVVLCVILLGVSSWRLASRYSPESWPALFVAVSLIVGMASFWARLVHLSLLSHFLIVFALASYYGDRASGGARWGPWTILLPISFYINFYVTVMVVSIFIASILDNRRR